jgi:hypothetical protein
MIDRPKEKQFRHLLQATPTGKYYIQYVDPENPRGRLISENMTGTAVHELCHKQWPGRYSDADIDERLRLARERRNVELDPPGSTPMKT